jgi:hypothetical protein
MNKISAENMPDCSACGHLLEILHHAPAAHRREAPRGGWCLYKKLLGLFFIL